VYSYSRGFPRLINTICENALISAYARQSSTVTGRIIEDVAAEFRLDAFVPVQQNP
jgi:type II secretory pathway predicted ATPase ExeA